jgi:hypothetical protein
MNAQISPEPTRNGFTALPQAEKEWFLIRVREMPHRAAVNERPAMSGRAAV